MRKKTSKYKNTNFSKALKNGELEAYSELYEQHYTRLCNYILKLSNNRSLAEDVVQESFIILWEKRSQINIEFNIDSYLFKICHNKFLEHVRKQKKERAFLDEIKSEAFYEINSYEEQLFSKTNLVNKLINELPPKCKEAFILSKRDKLKYKEIADKMGVSTKTVEAHITKAFKFLKANVNSFLFQLL